MSGVVTAPVPGLTVVQAGRQPSRGAHLRGRRSRAIAARWTAGQEASSSSTAAASRSTPRCRRSKIPKKTYAGLRITDPETLDVVVSVLSGIVNKMLVAELRSLGILAAGISGADGDTLVGRVPSADRRRRLRLRRARRPTRIRRSSRAILGAGLLPVVASVALGREGTLLNVNADSAAARSPSASGPRRSSSSPTSPAFSTPREKLVPRARAARRRSALRPARSAAECVRSSWPVSTPSMPAWSGSSSPVPGRPRLGPRGRNRRNLPCCGLTPPESFAPVAVEERDARTHVLGDVQHARRSIPAAGKGAKLFDADGKEYWDLLGGIAVNALGHQHPAAREGAEGRGDELSGTSRTSSTIPAQGLLAERLVRALRPARRSSSATAARRPSRRR